MSRATFNRLVRRAVVLAATVAVIGIAVGTVQVAATWRAEAAPLDTAPVSMSAVSTDMEAEVARTGTLSAQINDVAGQLVLRARPKPPLSARLLLLSPRTAARRAPARRRPACRVVGRL